MNVGGGFVLNSSHWSRRVFYLSRLLFRRGGKAVPFYLEQLSVVVHDFVQALSHLLLRIGFQSRFFCGIVRRGVEIAQNLAPFVVGDAVERGVLPVVSEVADLLDG